MDFIAIDFEIANSNRYGPCEIGLVKVINNKIAKKLSFLIKPKENYFDSFNTYLHGIDESTAEKEPKTSYSCTYQMSKQHVKGQFFYKLNSLCKYYKIELDHHRVLPDSIACAEIAIRIFKEREITEFSQIGESFDLKIGKLFKGGYSGSLKKYHGYKISEIEFDKTKYKPNNPFFMKTVIFTGALSMIRKEAQLLDLEVRGKCGKSITTDTNYLVVEAQDYHRYGEGFKCSKMKKAEKYLSIGQQIELLTEEQFIEMINEE